MSLKTIIIAFSLCLVHFNCSVSKSDIAEYKNKFETNRKEFENLIVLLKGQNLRVGYAINENDLPKNIQGILDDLDISSISVKVTDCKELPAYEFVTAWSDRATLYFSKDYCTQVQTAKTYHVQLSPMIEVWGMGDNWVMVIDYDPI